MKFFTTNITDRTTFYDNWLLQPKNRYKKMIKTFMEISSPLYQRTLSSPLYQRIASSFSQQTNIHSRKHCPISAGHWACPNRLFDNHLAATESYLQTME